MNISFKGGVQAKISRMGVRGKDGRSIELELVNEWICWRYIGDTDWIQLINISTLLPDFSRDEIIAAIGYEPATESQGVLAETAVQPATLATALLSKLDVPQGSVDQYIDGTGQLQTMPAGGGGAQADWNATSGPSAILNKPILGSAAYAELNAFATAAQGVLATTAVQPAALNAYSLTTHTHSNATTTAAGFMSAADKIKLNDITAGATVNSTDAELRNRATHTGQQGTETITGLVPALTTLETEINDVDNKIDGIDTRVTTTEGAIAAITPRVSTLETNLAAANSLLDDVIASTSNTAAEIVDVRDIAVANRTRLNTLEPRVDSAEGDIELNRIAIEGLDTSITTITNTLNNLQSNVASNANSIANLTTAVANTNAAVTAVDARVDSTNATISTISADIEDISTDLAALSPLVANNTTNITALAGRVSTNETAIANTNANIGTLTSRVAANEAATTAANTTANQAVANIASVRADVVATNTRIDNLSSNVASIDLTIADHETRITDLRTDVDSINTQIGPINTAIGANETAIANVRLDLTSTTNRVAVNETAIANTNNRVTQVAANVATLQSNVSTLQTNVSNLNAQVVQINSNVSTLASTVSQHTSNISNIENDIDTITADIESVANAANTNATNITTLQSTVGNHSTSIANIDSRVANNASDITALNATLNTKLDIPSGTADQYLNGLGVPTSRPVGKPIIIVASGQSNMANIVEDVDGDFDYPENMNYWNYWGDPASVGTAFFRPANIQSGTVLSFAKSVALDNPTSQVYIINVSFGGQSITCWSDNTPIASRTAVFNNVPAALVAAGLTTDTIVDYFLWWQGEADGDEPLRSQFTARTDTWLNQLDAQTWYDRHETKNVFFSIADAPRLLWEGYTQINRLLRDIAINRGDIVFVDSSDLVDARYWQDEVHPSALGYYIIGRRGYRVTNGGGRQPSFNRYIKEDLLTGAIEVTGNGIRFQDYPIQWNQDVVPHSNGRHLDIFKQHYDPAAVIVGTTTPGTATYTRRGVHYTRIGDVIFYTITMEWSGHTGTGNMRFNSLPLSNYFGMPLDIACHFRESPAYENPTDTVALWDVWENTISFFNKAPGGALTPKPVPVNGQLSMIGSVIRLRETT